MEHIAVIVAVALLSLFIFFSGVRSFGKGDAGTMKITSTVSESRGMGRSEIQRRLEKLAKSEPPTELSAGACCYEMAAPPDRAEYICPKCNEKTLYAEPRVAKGNYGFHGLLGFVQWEIPGCRRVVKSIKRLNVELDESQFCQKCSPNIKEPKLVLVVHYKGEKKPHRCEGVTLDDLNLVREFLRGKKKHAGRMGDETPLKHHVKRLNELLGVEVNLPDEKVKEHD